MGCNYYNPYVDKQNMSTSSSFHSEYDFPNRVKKKKSKKEKEELRIKIIDLENEGKEQKEKLYKKEEENKKIKEELNEYKKIIMEKEQELRNKSFEIKKREEDISKKQSNINSKNNEYEAKKIELMQKEKDLFNKEKIINEKNEKLNIKELSFENKQKIFEKKNKELYQKESNIKNKEINIKKKETIIDNKNMELNQKEIDIKNKEKNIDNKFLELNQKELDIENKQKIIDNRHIELNQKEINIENKLKIIDNKYLELNQKETNIENKEKNIDDKYIELNQKEINIKNKEKIINDKYLELNQKVLDFENKQKIIDNRNIELNQKESKIKNKEIDLAQQMIEFEKNKNKIIEDSKNQKIVPILIGLNNIGATCYMNSTLQCLSNTNKLTEYFLTKYKQNPNRIMTNVYHKLLLNLWDIKKNNKSYSPYEFKEVLSKENPLFAGIAANDSKDLINFLIERFHQELNEVKVINNSNNNNINIQDQTNEQLMLNSFIKEFQEKYNSPISSLFYGMMETKSQCQGCQIIKYNFQVYSFLEFPLQQVNQFCFNNGKRALYNIDGTNPDIDLYECFEYYQKIDLMNGENQMYCNFCNKLCDSFYSTTIYSGPLILIINLNRGRGAVYECKVNFPEQLILFNYVIFKDGYTAYQLYAVICHLGPSSMSGHFVAYCRNRIDNKWYLYNDGMVSLCSKQRQYQDGMPYILFYKALGD